MKRYNYSQHLCYDCSTIERESELSTAVVPLIPVSLQPFILVHYLRTFTSVYPYNPFFVPLHRCHDTRPCSGTALYMEWISAQPPHTETAQQSFQAISQKVNRTIHALHHSCLVSESTILHYYNAHVSLPQP